MNSGGKDEREGKLEEEEVEEEEQETEISKALERDFLDHSTVLCKGHTGTLTWAGILPPSVS